MKRDLLLFVFAISIMGMMFSTSCKKDTDSTPTDYTQELQTMIDSNWNAYWDQGVGPLGGLMMKINTPDGEYFVSSNYNDTVSQDVHFRGGSTTKMFTAASIMLLEEQGKLDIDAVITDIIPEKTEPYIPDLEMYNIPYKNEITIRQLMQHTAGVFDVTNTPIPMEVQQPYAGMIYNNYIDFVIQDINHEYTLEEFINVVAENQLTSGAPNIEFHYSNVGYMLLGVIVERVGGVDFDQFVTNNFAEPLGMNHTLFSHDPYFRLLPAPFVHGYIIYEGNPVDATEYINLSSGVAAGNIITTCNDLNNWTKSLLTGNAGISQEGVNTMMDYMETHESHGYYGLGINYTPGLGYGHNGGVFGYMTITRYNPDNQVVFTINASYIEMVDLYKEGDLLYSIAEQAYAILGY